MSRLSRLPLFAREAAHAAGGAPRLYRAARAAGASRVAAGSVLASSAVVLFVVAPRAAGVPGRQNAVRHFVWQAYLTARHGPAVARAVADAQERDSLRSRDSAIDRRNNAVAQAYAAAHAAEIADLGPAGALRALLRAGLAKWDAGELAGGVRRGRAGGFAARRRRRSSRGRATPPSQP
jgi:hypothetical protein